MGVSKGLFSTPFGEEKNPFFVCCVIIVKSKHILNTIIKITTRKHPMKSHEQMMIVDGHVDSFF